VAISPGRCASTPRCESSCTSSSLHAGCGCSKRSPAGWPGTDVRARPL
jgi:hypothetical protein